MTDRKLATWAAEAAVNECTAQGIEGPRMLTRIVDAILEVPDAAMTRRQQERNHWHSRRLGALEMRDAALMRAAKAEAEVARLRLVAEAGREVRADARRVGLSQVKVNPHVFDRFLVALTRGEE